MDPLESIPNSREQMSETRAKIKLQGPHLYKLLLIPWELRIIKIVLSFPCNPHPSYFPMYYPLY